MGIRGDKQRALGDTFLERPAWHEAEGAGVLAVEGEHVIAPILSGQVVDGDRHFRWKSERIGGAWQGSGRKEFQRPECRCGHEIFGNRDDGFFGEGEVQLEIGAEVVIGVGIVALG